MEILLSRTELFDGIEEPEIASLLQCLAASRRSYRKGDVILAEGDATDHLGVVLSGMAIISTGDIWGNNSLLGHVGPGSVFAEVYACLPGEPLRISVSAAEDTQVLFMDIARVLGTCPSACPFHARLIRNLLTVCARKSLQLSQRILHTSPKSVRGRLLSFLSEWAIRSGSRAFRIPYNRQQLADYLGVDRSALCSELSKMRREGLIDYQRSQFLLREAPLP